MAAATTLPEGCASIRLHPFIIRPVADDEYAIVRADGGAVVRTREMGVAVVRQLRRNPDLARVRRVIEEASGSPVDLQPLLDSLLRAGLVRAADGRTVDATRMSLRRRVRCLWRCYGDPGNRVTRAALAYLPPAYGLRVVRPLRRRLIRHSRAVPEGLQLAARVAPGWSAAPPAELRELHIRALAGQDALARMLVHAHPAALDRWMARQVSVRGTEHLDQLQKAGRGAIVAFLHHGAFPLIPVKLLSLGYSFHGFHWSVDFAGGDFAGVFRRHAEMRGWGTGEYLGLPNLPKIAALVGALRAGGIATVMPDFYSPPASDASARARAFHGEARPNLDPSTVAVSIGGARVLVHGWIGWLVRRSGAAVVPARCVVDQRGEYRVEFGSPLEWTGDMEGSARDAEAVITREVFTALSPEIVTSPEEWTFLARYRPAPRSELEKDR